MSEEGQLLFISDLEGCLPEFLSQKQNVSLCDKSLYEKDGALWYFLTNKKNKIAFLGDYFDKGPGVEESIISIANLSNHKDFSGQVHIILGNRDINKLRLFYELKNKDCFKNTTGGWPIWNDFFKNANALLTEQEEDHRSSSKEDELINIILTESMGADGLTPKWCNDDNTCKDKQKIYIKQLVKVFTDPTDPSVFAKAVKTIFQKGNIVEFDRDFKVLMSHAGGFDNIVFDNYEARIENIREELSNSATAIIAKAPMPSESTESLSASPSAPPTTNTTEQPSANYFAKIELARNLLMGPYSGTRDTTFSLDNLPVYNSILRTVVTSVFDNSAAEPVPDFFILQASGLKPDISIDDENPANGVNLEKFASFIQSCGSGCGTGLHQDKKAISNYVTSYDNTTILSDNKIKFIAHGHVPHCLPFPLIVSHKHVTFLHNDTSNGQKQTKYVGETINKLPLSFIEKKGDAMNGRIGLLSESGILTKISKNTEDMPTDFNNEYRAFISEMNETPMTLDNLKNSIVWNGLNTAKVNTPAATATPASGGKTRRRRKNRSRNSKKASSKRRPRRNRSRNRK